MSVLRASCSLSAQLGRQHFALFSYPRELAFHGEHIVERALRTVHQTQQALLGLFHVSQACVHVYVFARDVFHRLVLAPNRAERAQLRERRRGTGGPYSASAIRRAYSWLNSGTPASAQTCDAPR